MIIGIPKEDRPGETRVALVPETVKALVKAGHQVVVEASAGEAASYADQDYRQAGATVALGPKAMEGVQLVARVNRPGWNASPQEAVKGIPQGAALVSFLQPFQQRPLLEALAARNITAFSMELIPRISRAQSMDALSSQATVAGYKAVLLAANRYPRFLPMFMTAAGTIQPARALILGAGVAGLQAIATARRLGAVVEAFDTRPVVKDQVESLGARFIALDTPHEDAQDAGGYAKALSEDQHQRELELIAQRIAKADLVITTAQIPGKKSPLLVTRAMVESMRPGSVIVDLAAEGGGNCELTKADQEVEHQGVLLLGPTNLPAHMPSAASWMYARNLVNLLGLMAGPQGLKEDLGDDILKGSLVTRGGKIVHPALG
ncbi:MAG: Re/Si-specific NAD(P)(+) transhydrogenase subunit alpha [Deltaproteobacteria bacterium]|nr:Re/Si-specific NAD(P)(+) transhydrogenase subunit alpha [Deltaproteobacteria bacterium]MDH4122024.1 Re/Si-specific NAD(P)(+) transhydrogenase subunit alpha [Deltaproteobacteria bacterium]